MKKSILSFSMLLLLLISSSCNVDDNNEGTNQKSKISSQAFNSNTQFVYYRIKCERGDLDKLSCTNSINPGNCFFYDDAIGGNPKHKIVVYRLIKKGAGNFCREWFLTK